MEGLQPLVKYCTTSTLPHEGNKTLASPKLPVTTNGAPVAEITLGGVARPCFKPACFDAFSSCLSRTKIFSVPFSIFREWF
jgi:hypothetical protein